MSHRFDPYSTSDHVLHDRMWRIHVCQDVIEQVQLKKYNVKQGLYVTFDAHGQEFQDACWSMKLLPLEKQSKIFLDFKFHAGYFNVCALGAICVSILRMELDCIPLKSIIKNEKPLGEWRIDGNDIEYSCDLLFVRAQQKLMEQAFEGDEQNQQNQAANDFHDRYQNDDDRLIAIMKNIIKNDGVFRLENRASTTTITTTNRTRNVSKSDSRALSKQTINILL